MPVLDAQRSPSYLKFHFLAWPSGLYQLACAAWAESSSAPCYFSAQPLSGNDLPGQPLPCFYYSFLNFFLSLHLWLVEKSSIPNSVNRIYNLGLFLYRNSAGESGAPLRSTLRSATTVGDADSLPFSHKHKLPMPLPNSTTAKLSTSALLKLHSSH